MVDTHEMEQKIVEGVSGDEYISLRVPGQFFGMTDKLLTREEYARMLNDRGGGAVEEGEQVVS